MFADLPGYDPGKANGIFTFGGLGTWLYAVKVGLTKALGKESRYTGIRQEIFLWQNLLLIPSQRRISSTLPDKLWA